MLAPLGATSGLEFSQRNEHNLDVAPNGADRLFFARIYKDVAPTEPNPLSGAICYSFGFDLKSPSTADAATEPASIGFTSSGTALPAAPEACC